MAFLGKLYKWEKQENYEAFADTYDIPEDKKKIIINYKADQKYVKEGDTYTQYLFFNGEERTTTFKSGEEFERTLSTVPIKNVFTVDGNTITQVIKSGDNHNIITTIKKVFTDDKLEETATNTKSSVVAKRYYSV